MRRSLTATLALALVALLMSTAAAPATAQIVRPQPAQIAAAGQAPVTPAHWRGGGRGAGIALGIGAGMLLGGALAAGAYPYGPYPYGPYYGAPYVYGPSPVYAAPPDDEDAVAYCMQRFRSYDPGSGTYLGYDGLRHPCP